MVSAISQDYPDYLSEVCVTDSLTLQFAEENMYREVNGPGKLAAIRPSLWPANKILRCRFVDQSISAALEDKIVTWVKEYEKYANIDIRFLDKSDTQHADIRIAFSPNHLNCSFIGLDNLNSQVKDRSWTMNLYGVHDNQDDADSAKIVLHQFGTRPRFSA